MSTNNFNANFFTTRKLDGVEPCRVRRSGIFKLKKMYEYSINSAALLGKVVRENPDVPVRQFAGITTGGIA